MPIRTKKANFTTSSQNHMDKDFYFERNKHITDNSEKVETVSTSPVDKSLTTEKLQEKWSENQELMSSNMNSTKGLLDEAARLAGGMRSLYSSNKSKLSESQRNSVGENLGINSTRYDTYGDSNTEVDKAFSNIRKGQKLMADSMYRINTLQDTLPQDKSSITRQNNLDKAEDVINRFNSLSHNIETLSSKNQDIRKELDKRNNSTYHAQDSSDVVQTDFSSFEPFDD